MQSKRPAAHGRLLTFPVPVALARPALAVAALGLSAAAQGQAFIVSTSGDAGSVDVNAPAFYDEDLIHVRPGAAPRPFFQAAHFSATGSFVPGDVDAFAFEGTGGAAAMRMSLLSNEGGFLDGDVLGLLPGGDFGIIVEEATLTAALGAPDANIDIDALAYDGAGRLMFSLQSDLDGTALGTIQNGDVLRLELDGTITRQATEADVDAALSVAMGTTATAGDVHALEFLANEIVVGVQSPSDADGGVLRLGNQPLLIVDDMALGLLGEELDALCSDPSADESVDVWFEVTGIPGAGIGTVAGAPNHPFALIPSASVGYESASYLGGFGAFYLDPNDPYIASSWALVLDGSGRWSTSTVLPPSSAGAGWNGAQGWSFQVLDLISLELSAPIRVDV